ncbi:MAG: hypothetical protein KBC02_00470, partial [Candidatus Pacebacteria bacterium]|nr:hypothetical protein [Candidatus Paceibacterota bacterium]
SVLGAGVGSVLGAGVGSVLGAGVGSATTTVTASRDSAAPTIKGDAKMQRAIMKNIPMARELKRESTIQKLYQ